MRAARAASSRSSILMPSVYVGPVEVGSHTTPHLLVRLFKPQSEAYLGSVTGRRGTSQKDPYRAYVNKKRAAQDENRALGDTTVLSLSVSR